eukprot:5671935-Pyramimonas_sp.AAC.2
MDLRAAHRSGQRFGRIRGAVLLVHCLQVPTAEKTYAVMHSRDSSAIAGASSTARVYVVGI